ncbi:MAG: hypothetical protein AB7O37_11360 [Vicinamibacteria bacterium]
MLSSSPHLSACGLLASTFLSFVGPARPAAAAQEAAREPSFRLLRSTSGSKGALRSGRYEVEDPRSTFSLPSDRQIIVYFDWEAVPGVYRFEGRWKDPTGKVVLVAPVDQEVTARQLGLYWTLALPERTATGLWALEVAVGGASIGTHSFEIQAAPGSGLGVLSAADLYQRAQRTVAGIDGIGSSGEVLATGVATAFDADLVFAPFPAIDGATSLRVRVRDGRSVEAREIGSRNRREGWAAVRVPNHGLDVLQSATRRPAVGERVFVLDTTDDGARVIAEASVVGQGTFSTGRPLLRLHAPFAQGSPILSDGGQLIGFVVAGSDALLGPTGVRFGSYLSQTPLRGNMVFAPELLPLAPAAKLTTLAALASAGEFVKPLSPAQRDVISGVFAARVERGGSVPMPVDQRASFSRRERAVSVFVQWNPQQKREVMSGFEVYDADNHLVVTGEPTKLKLKPRELFFSTWTFGIEHLSPGTYRVELVLDSEPIWRGYLRVSE